MGDPVMTLLTPDRRAAIAMLIGDPGLAAWECVLVMHELLDAYDSAYALLDALAADARHAAALLEPMAQRIASREGADAAMAAVHAPPTWSDDDDDLAEQRERLRHQLHDLGLPTKIVNQLDYRYRSVDAIATTRDAQLLALRMIGTRSLRQIRAVIPYRPRTTIDDLT